MNVISHSDSTEELIKPHIKIEAGLVESIVMFLVAKKTFSSNPLLIYQAPINRVMDTYNYCKFLDQYQEELKELNKKEE